jgi:peptidoglycan/LPS O-acetylase OafA/YrhL
MARPYLPQLDGLRAIAIFLVLLSHSAGEFTQVRWFSLFDRYGSLGVQLFFVLSGFLITSILLESKDSQKYFINFFSRRGLRIYPLYYAVLALVAFSGVVHRHGVHWWVYALYLSNLFYGHTTQPAPLGPTWSLAVEEQFYLTWPFLIKMLNRRGVERLSLALILGSFVARFILPLPPHNTLFQLDALAAGALLACRIEEIYRWRRLGMGLVFLLPFGAVYTNGVMNNISQSLQVFGAAGLLVLCLNEVEPITIIFSNGILRYFGRISYGMYLLHAFILGAFLSTHIAHSVIKSGSTWKALLCLSVEYLLVVGLASASFYLLERPFLLLKRYFSNDRPAVTIPALETVVAADA